MITKEKQQKTPKGKETKALTRASKQTAVHPQFQAVYEAFVWWYALPRHERPNYLNKGMERLVDFARAYDVGETTLWRWSNKPSFQNRVKEIWKTTAKGNTPDVVRSIYLSAIGGGKEAPQAQKLWMQVVEDWNERSELAVEETKKLVISVNDVRFLIEALPEQLKQKHYANLRELLDDNAAHGNSGNIDRQVIELAEKSENSGGDDGLENSIPGQTDHNAQDVQNEPTDELAKSNTSGLCCNLVRATSAYNHQSSAWWWEK